MRVMVFGVGAFSHGVLDALSRDGAEVCTYLTRSYGHYGPSLVGPIYDFQEHPNPCSLLQSLNIDFVVPMSLEWMLRPWADEFLSLGIPILCPVGSAIRLERERDFARELCDSVGIPFPKSYFARNENEARLIVESDRRGFVIKNPLCSPTSPIHTILCETSEETLSWLPRIDYSEGVFLQEYVGRREVGHIAFISNGEVHSLVTNQEYKRAFNGNMGIVAGAPLGGLIEIDQNDSYGLAAQLIEPLLPWFQDVGYNGPVQVTAALHEGVWKVLEYNVRIGITAGPMIVQAMSNPAQVLAAVCRNETPNIRFRDNARFGCSITLAGFGYPYISVTGPKLPITVEGDVSGSVLWSEVEMDSEQRLLMTGHRIADIYSLAPSLNEAISKSYREIRKIHCLSSYYRTDIGESLWPPGSE